LFESPREGVIEASPGRHLAHWKILPRISDPDRRRILGWWAVDGGRASSSGGKRTQTVRRLRGSCL